MKKSLLFAIIITLVAILCSCNVDAQDGIYSKIADSTLESSTKVQAYLGQYDKCYYFLTDENITRKPYAEGQTITFKDIPATGENFIEEAALLSDGTILVRRHDAKVYKYNNKGTLADTPVIEAATTQLLNNGVIVAENGWLFKSDGSKLIQITNIQTVLECGNLVLGEDTDHKICIYNSSGTPELENIDSSNNKSTTVGFQQVGSSYYILKSNGSVYKVDNSNQKLDSNTLVTTLSYSLATGKTSSFTYKDSTGTDYVVFKTSESFIEINTTTKEINSITTGYGSIRQNLVVNIKQFQDTTTSNQIIIATWSNGVYKIDPTTKSSEQIL